VSGLRHEAVDREYARNAGQLLQPSRKHARLVHVRSQDVDAVGVVSGEFIRSRNVRIASVLGLCVSNGRNRMQARSEQQCNHCKHAEQ